jgi:GTPase KRas protein
LIVYTHIVQAGREEYNAMKDQYIRAAQGFILLYSITDKTSFEGLNKHYEDVMRVKEMLKEDPDQVPMILSGNKCDLGGDRQVTEEEGRILAKRWNVPFFETSAKLKISIQL